MGSPFLGTRKPVVTCSKIEDRLYPDICVSKNTQKRFFRQVPGSLRNGTSVGIGSVLEPNRTDRFGLQLFKITSVSVRFALSPHKPKINRKSNSGVSVIQKI